jgi:hypothetical protein
MSEHRVYVDFMKTDDEGRLLLTCIGTRRDLETQGVQLREGLVLCVYSDDLDEHGNRDDLVAKGVVRFDPANRRWVLEVDREAIRNASDEKG